MVNLMGDDDTRNYTNRNKIHRQIQREDKKEERLYFQHFSRLQKYLFKMLLLRLMSIDYIEEEVYLYSRVHAI